MLERCKACGITKITRSNWKDVYKRLFMFDIALQKNQIVTPGEVEKV